VVLGSGDEFGPKLSNMSFFIIPLLVTFYKDDVFILCQKIKERLGSQFYGMVFARYKSTSAKYFISRIFIVIVIELIMIPVHI
jgi:hypothetical protein